MDSTHTFRKALLRRLLDVGAAVAIAGPALAGCGAKVAADGTGGVTGAGGAGTAGGTVGTGMGGIGGGSGCVLPPPPSGGTGGKMSVSECFAVPEGGCPNQYNATMYIVPASPCVYLASVDCGPVVVGASCCYAVTEEPKPCGTGRPFLLDGEARMARAEVGDRGWSEADLAPAIDGLDDRARAALAHAWSTDALAEHASVASFSRFALELLAAGAPADLIAAAHRAALDEVVHARLCFALASAYAGAPLAPSAIPMDGAVPVSGDLAALAAATAREGCIGETLGALLAAEQLARATDPAVRRALAVIAEDEARHAELAWRTVAWAVERGGAPVRAALRDVFGNAARHLPGARPLGHVAAGVAAAHGRLDPEASCKAVIRALAEVILPSAAGLLGPEGPAFAAMPVLAPRDATDGEPATQRSPA
jgi:hypothetical protein